MNVLKIKLPGINISLDLAYLLEVYRCQGHVENKNTKSVVMATGLLQFN